MQGVYDDETEKPDIKPSHDGSHDDLGVDPKRRAAEAKDLDNLYNAEASPESAAGGKAEEKEKDKLSDQVGKGFTGDDGGGSQKGGKKGRFRITRKQAAAGGAAGLLAGGAFWFFTFASGPLQFIHFAQLLQGFHFSSNEDFGSMRAGRILMHWRKGTLGSSLAKTRLGVTGNKIATKMELRLKNEAGIKLLYNNDTGRLAGVEIVDTAKAIDFFGDIDPSTVPELNTWDRPSDAHTRLTDIDGSPPSSKNPIASLEDGGFKGYKISRKFLKIVTKHTKTNGLTARVSSRLLKKRAGVDFHPLKTPTRYAADKVAAFIRQKAKERFKSETTGTEPTGQDPSNPENGEDGKPKPDTPDGAEARGAQSEASDGGRSVHADPSAKPGMIENIKGKVLKAGSFIGIACAIKAIGDNIEKVKYTNIILPLIRVGMRVITMGNQIMSGQVNIYEVGEISKDLYDTEKRTSWSGARSIQYELGQEMTGPDTPPNAKPSRVGQKPMLFGVIDSILNAIPGVGDAVCSTFGQILITISGGLGSIIQDVLSRTLSYAGLNPIDYFVEWLVDWLSGSAVNVQAKGADLGNIANYGARLGANDHALATGGVRLTEVETAQLKSEYDEDVRSDLQRKSFFARTFDLNNPYTPLSKLVFETPAFSSPQSMMASLLSSPTNLFSTFSKIFTPKTFAATQKYDYGFDKYGFSLADQENPLVQDPYENAEAVVNYGVEKLNERYEKCFSMRVNLDTGNPESGAAVKFNEIPEECNDKNDPWLLRYRFFLADTIAADSLGCYFGEESSCSNVGMGGTSATAAGPVSEIPSSELYQDSTGVPCAPGTQDVGVEDGYTGGNLVKIKRCAIPGFPSGGKDDNGVFGAYDGGMATVNSRVSGNVLAMVQAANKDGVQLRASSAFRSMANQQSLCPCDGVRVARPGYSNHQMGLAIDFSGLPSSAGPVPGSKVWEWLSAHAGEYGFKNYPAEAWHWSVTGH